VEGFVKEPRELELPLKELGLDEMGEGEGWKVGEVELGGEGMWVVLEETRREDGGILD